jgi:hypothetical protein
LRHEFFAMLSAVQDWAGFEVVWFDHVFDLPKLSELSGAGGSVEGDGAGARGASGGVASGAKARVFDRCLAAPLKPGSSRAEVKVKSNGQECPLHTIHFYTS